MIRARLTFLLLLILSGLHCDEQAAVDNGIDSGRNSTEIAAVRVCGRKLQVPEGPPYEQAQLSRLLHRMREAVLASRPDLRPSVKSEAVREWCAAYADAYELSDSRAEAEIQSERRALKHLLECYEAQDNETPRAANAGTSRPAWWAGMKKSVPDARSVRRRLRNLAELPRYTALFGAMAVDYLHLEAYVIEQNGAAALRVDDAELEEFRQQSLQAFGERGSEQFARRRLRMNHAYLLMWQDLLRRMKYGHGVLVEPPALRARLIGALEQRKW